MTYTVKEIFYTLQGEGAQSGRAAVFCRFSGCNLWSGREEDRSRAVCQFCDTDFVGVEPLLQLDEKLIDALHERGFEVAVETNGTRPAPTSLDWICVSPKAGAPFVQKSGSELKLVYPQADALPEKFTGLDFRHFFLQPMDGPDIAENTERAIAYCLAHPGWRLSIQTHKLVGIR
jgi:7-carboxy-7-deazaguanine synthase